MLMCQEELSYEEKQHITSLVKSAGSRKKGVLISDVTSLYTWSNLANGFDARFLAILYDCQLQIPHYANQELNRKLDRWVSWYRSNLNEKPMPSFDSLQKLSHQDTMPLAASSLSSKTWKQKCIACGGYGTQQTREVVCEYCEGTGWMSFSQFQKFRSEKATLNRKSHSPVSVAASLKTTKDEWKKSLVVCPICDGDGGAAGHCYKCEGSGWVKAK